MGKEREERAREVCRPYGSGHKARRPRMKRCHFIDIPYKKPPFEKKYSKTKGRGTMTDHIDQRCSESSRSPPPPPFILPALLTCPAAPNYCDTRPTHPLPPLARRSPYRAFDAPKVLEMATSRSLVLVIFLGLVVSFVAGESEPDVSSLESKLGEDVRSKTMDKLEQLKVDSAMAKIRELESKIESLEEEASKLRTEADLHANRAKSVEETAAGHLSDKEKAIRALEEQKTRLQRAERGLQVAEAAMLKAKAEAEEKAKRLDALHQAWLPPWAATHAETLQRTASSRWSTHAEPVVRNLKRSASTKAAGAHEYVKPHLDTFHTKVNPVIQEKWQKLASGLAPHLETVKKAAASSRDYITPHVNTVHQTVNPYVEAMKEKSRPYIEQAKAHAAPHMERVNTIAGPHYKRAVKTANSYHALVQSHLREKLGKHSISAWLATNTVFISGLAAAILALPFATLFMFLRSLLCSPPKAGHHKRHRSSHSGGSSSNSKKPRRAKQVDKSFDTST